MNLEYPFEIRPLTPAEGGGYQIRFPDLPNCISDGETPQEAIQNGLDALEGWIETRRDLGLEIPKPGSAELEPVKLVARLPQSLHRSLTKRAKQEGVSLNTLLIMLLSAQPAGA
jgi:antitoxin HicB